MAGYATGQGDHGIRASRGFFDGLSLVARMSPRTVQICGRVFRDAIATGRAERDPSRDLSSAVAPIQEKSEKPMAASNPSKTD